MKSFLVWSAVVCVILISAEKAHGALPNCTAAAGTGCPENANCTAAGQPCQCNGGYHLNAGADGCAADLPPGAACTTAGGSTQCVSNATCTNATAGVRKCACDDGFHAMSGACAVDKKVGESCTKVNEDMECEANATCTNTNTNATGTPMLQCVCKSGHHMTKAGSCYPDIQLGGVCTDQGNDTECVDNAVCMAVTSGQTPMCTCKTEFHNVSLACVADKKPGNECATSHECVSNAACLNQSGTMKCMCNTGFHVSADACKADIGAGQVCTMVNASTECVDHATCKTVSQNGNQTTDQCVCNEDYHAAGNATGQQMCAADTCQHSVNKCKDAGMSTCSEIVTYVGCVVTSVCNASDAEQVNVTTQALQDVRTKIPSTCNMTTTDCLQKVSSCFLDHLKENMTCRSVSVLETCLTGADSTCTQGEDVQTLALAKAARLHMADTLSCKCVNAIETCRTKAREDLGNATGDKCSAVSELFQCVVTADCDVSKTIDHKEVSGIWSTAMRNATMYDCKDKITEAAATTCPLQLTRCALIYGQQNHNSTDKMVTCRASEAFGKCLKDKTTNCSGQEAKKKPFTDEYAAISSTCQCENDVARCVDDAGVIPTDPFIVCPKMQAFSRCLMSAKCDMTQEKDPLNTEYKNYKNYTSTANCSTPTEKSCVTDVTICAQQVITNVSEGGVSAANLCKVSQRALQCVNAANCSLGTESDSSLVSTFTNGTLYRMQIATCQVPECLKRLKDVTDCKTTYQTAITAAGADSNKKCTAMNNMVKCLRGPLCNPYLKDMVDALYNNLTAGPGCDLLSLKETSGASAPHFTILTALLTVLLGFFVVRM